MFRLGVTGGIGSGKSLVCGVLEKLGVPVYYADREAQRLMNSNAELRRGIESVFGNAIYSEGTLDRKELGRQVFGDHLLLEKLNKLVHPLVQDDFMIWSESGFDAPYVVEEAAILFESGSAKNMDLTVIVYAPEALRIKRVEKRDGISSSEVKLRMNKQMNEEEKLKLADRVLYNDEASLLLPQIIELHEDILKRI